MASYPNILPPPQTDGFLQGLGRGISQGSNAYTTAASSDYFEQLKEKRKREQEQAQQKLQAEETNKAIEKSGLNPYQVSSGPSGMTTTYRQPEPLSKDNINRAMAGMGGEELVGPAFNVPRPMPLPQSMAQSQFPVSSMTGQAGNISQSGGSMDYGKIVQQALRQKFAPGMDDATISRDYLGLPQPEAELTPETKNVIENIKNKADLEEFLENEIEYAVSGVNIKAVRKYFGME